MSYTERACAIDLSLQSQHSCVRHLGNALDKRDWRWHPTSAFSQRLRKYTFTAVHTKTHQRRLQIYPLWRAFSNLCFYGERFHRLRVDGRPKRIKKFAFFLLAIAFTIVFVWTGPKVTETQHSFRTKPSVETKRANFDEKCSFRREWSPTSQPGGEARPARRQHYRSVWKYCAGEKNLEWSRDMFVR